MYLVMGKRALEDIQKSRFAQALWETDGNLFNAFRVVQTAEVTFNRIVFYCI